MTYETKMSQVRALIEAFNASADDIPNIAAERVNLEAFENKLQQIGASSDETLALASWEDLQECGLPKLLARQVAEKLRTPEKKADDDYLSPKKVDRMRFEELIARYDPREDNALAHKLQELSGGKRFVVFLRDGTVDQGATLRLLLELKRGYGEVPVTPCGLRPSSHRRRSNTAGSC